MFCKATVDGVARLLSVSLTILLVIATDATVRSSGLFAGAGTGVAGDVDALGAEAAIEGAPRPDAVGAAVAMGEGVRSGDALEAGDGAADGEGVADGEGDTTGEGFGEGDAVGDG